MNAVNYRWKARDISYVALFAVIITVCSWISVPLVVPFTMQTFAVFVGVGILGGRRGTMAVLLYLLMGAIGLPVFAGFAGGMGILLGNTGGYLLGFLFSAVAMWVIETLFGNGKWVLLISMVLGLVLCYAFGTVWFMAVYARSTGSVGLYTALGWCVFPYVIPDLLKIALAMTLTLRLRGYVR